jgi:hypothetical protein
MKYKGTRINLFFYHKGDVTIDDTTYRKQYRIIKSQSKKYLVDLYLKMIKISLRNVQTPLSLSLSLSLSDKVLLL